MPISCAHCAESYNKLLGIATEFLENTHTDYAAVDRLGITQLEGIV